MSEISSTRGGGSASARRVRRAIGGLVGATVLVAASACGFNVQTLKPYTPAEGVNVNIGSTEGQAVDNTIKVRNLMVVSRSEGSGFLSASMTTLGSDTFTGASGHVIKSDGSQGSDLTITLASPISVANNNLVVLTDQTRIPVESADLTAGGTVSMTLTFAKAGSQQVNVPVIDGSFPPYSSVSPSPAASSASPSS